MHTGYTHTSHPKIQKKRDQSQNRLGQEVLKYLQGTLNES